MLSAALHFIANVICTIFYCMLSSIRLTIFHGGKTA
jgi:hypothetical protein